MLILAALLSPPGCSRSNVPVTPASLAATWESENHMFRLVLRPDGTFTKESRGRGGLLLGGVGFVADAGKWSVAGGELVIDTPMGAQMVLKAERPDENRLILKFGDGSAMTFKREPQK